MESSMEPELDTRGVVPIENPQKSSHSTPPDGCHGLCLPNPCRAAYLGGVSSGKTNALLCTLGQCHAWRPFKHRVSPVTVVTRQMQSDSVTESIVCSPSIKSCMIFIRQNAQHACIDRSELSLAGAGINVLGSVDSSTGVYQYDSAAIAKNIDGVIDRRQASAVGTAAAAAGTLEANAPYGFRQLQVQCGGAVQPREALSEMSAPEGKMSRAWQLYTEFIGRAAGYRAAPLSFSEYCGYHNSNFSSAPRAGDRGAFFLFDLPSSGR